MSFVIMDMQGLKNNGSDTNVKIPPNSNEGGYVGQPLPNQWNPNAKIKYHYIDQNGRSRYYNYANWDFNLKRYDSEFLNSMEEEFSINKLIELQLKRDSADILIRLQILKDQYSPYYPIGTTLNDAIVEITELRSQRDNLFKEMYPSRSIKYDKTNSQSNRSEG